MENFHPSCEWLETNRFGSFSMGSVDRIPRRKYHSLLVLREPGMGDPLNTVVDVGEYLEVGGTLYMLHCMDFGGRMEPKGFMHIRGFSCHPHPKWTYDLDGIRVERTLELDPQKDLVRVFYSIQNVSKPIQVRLRPMLACRPMHQLTQSNPFLNGNSKKEAGAEVIRPYNSLPPLRLRVSGVAAEYVRSGEWIDRVHYNTEQDRGYASYEDLFVPGEFEFKIKGNAQFVFELGVEPLEVLAKEASQKPSKEIRFPTPLNRLEYAAEQFQITTKAGLSSVIAGYPWFGHWARDTLISLPGFFLNTGRPRDIKTAIEILRSYGAIILDGLVRGGVSHTVPETSMVLTGIDTPLLFIRAVQALKESSPASGHSEFMPTVCKILSALKHGVDGRVHVSPDGGLFVKPGPWALTWMDAVENGQPVTPRNGFAVEINALFINAMHFALDWAEAHDKAFASAWGPLAEKANDAFLRRFWSEKLGYLADCHSGEVADFSLRPNQLWAISLPNSPISRERGARILEIVKNALVTPVGLRTLSPQDPKYRGKYHGSQHERDHAYHQGTIWPWLVGIYADSVQKIHGLERMRKELSPIIAQLTQHLDKEACLGQISEVFDGDKPHQPGGAPAQAWSVAELLRMLRKMES